jgi:hypothetical protein
MIGGTLLLAALAKLSEHTAKPRECAAAYAVVVLVFGLIFPAKGYGPVIVSTLAAFLGAWLLFSLLRHFQDSILLWILALITGLLAMGVISHYFRLSLTLPF